MRFTLTFALLGLLIMGCGRRDALLHKQLTGTWVRGDSGVMTINSDGSFHSRWTNTLTNTTKEWIYDGTWDVRDGFLITTTMKSEARNTTNSEAIGSVDHFTIIRVDATHLVTELTGEKDFGETNYFVRR
jgi:hypothetical protein